MALEAEQLDECHWLYRHTMVLFLIQPLAGEMQTHDMRLRCLRTALCLWRLRIRAALCATLPSSSSEVWPGVDLR